MTRSVPTFLVVGAGRAGTTSLVDGLRRHPRVYVTDPKEPHYFALHDSRPDFRGPGDQTSINQTAVTELDDYLALYPRDSDHLALGEGSVSSLYYHERAIPELLRVNPDMRVVALLREPVARAHSSFQYLRTQGREPETSFIAALEQEPNRQAANWHHLWHYSAMSKYADAVKAFKERLPPGQFGVWFYDDLERDYAGTLLEVLRFLDLPAVPGVVGDAPRVNISGTPRSPRLQRAIWWASGRPVLRRTARMMTSWHFREAVRSRTIRREVLPDAVHGTLAPLFEEDLDRLREVLASDVVLPQWLRSKSEARAS